MQIKSPTKNIHLPCDVGDTVYQVQTICDKSGKETKVIVPYRITRVLISEYGLKIEAYSINGGYVSNILFEPAWFNQFVFKTQKEAERAAG